MLAFIGPLPKCGSPLYKRCAMMSLFNLICIDRKIPFITLSMWIGSNQCVTVCMLIRVYIVPLVLLLKAT